MLNAPRGFDPGGFLTFDLARGTIRTAGSDSPALVVPATVVAGLATAPTSGEALGVLARALGESIGTALRKGPATSGDPLGASPEAFLTHLNGLLAVHGLGRLSIETFGDVLLVRAKETPLGEPAGATFLESLAAGILGAFLGEEVRCLSVGDAGKPAVLVASAGAIDLAAGWKRTGATAEEIAARLCRETRGDGGAA